MKKEEEEEAVVYRDKVEISRIRVPAGHFTSNNTAEFLAMKAALFNIESLIRDQGPILCVQLSTGSLSSPIRLKLKGQPFKLNGSQMKSV